VVALLVAGLSGGAGAQDSVRAIRIETLKSATPNGKPAVALRINGITVAQLAKEQRERTPERTLSVAAAQVAGAFRRGDMALSIEPTDERGRRFALMLDGQVLLVATDMEGKAWGAAPEALAATWRDNLERALAAVPAEAVSVAMPAATDERVVITDLEIPHPGLDGLPAPPEPETPEPGGILAQPLSTGVGTGSTAQVNTAVYQPAQLGGPEFELYVQVSGNKVSEQAAEMAITTALRTRLRLNAGEKLSWSYHSADSDSGAASPRIILGPGESSEFRVKYYTEETGGFARVRLDNANIPAPRESRLLFSNRPEQVSQPQLLYYAELPGHTSARLVSHHQNRYTHSLRYIARLVNTTEQDAQLHVIPGMVPPNINTFLAGFKSAEKFWFNLNRNSGYMVYVPAKTQVLLHEEVLPKAYTTSSYFKLSNLSSTPLRLETLALDPAELAPSHAMNDSPRASFEYYGEPYTIESASYSIGDPWLYLRIGENSLPALNGDGLLHGNYGMTYSYSVEVSNATRNPGLVFILLRGSGGEVKGQFFINGAYTTTPLVRGGDEHLLAEVPIKPGETKLVTIKGMALNGCFYPASVIFRETRLP
jgi:hypothetical protein